MKNSSLAFMFITLALFTINCGDKGPVSTSPGGGKPTTPGTPKKNPYVYGNEFLTLDGTAYEILLQACNRCGRKWTTSNYGGGRSYSKCAPLSSNSPLHCKNWTSKGYIQIEFAENKLPTSATVTIWPLYTYRNQEQWGQSFASKGTAEPINENKGFHITLTGLGGRALYVESETTNHVNGGSLNVEVRSGTGDRGTVMISADDMPRVKKNPDAYYSCGQRPPDLLQAGSTNAFCFSFGY